MSTITKRAITNKRKVFGCYLIASLLPLLSSCGELPSSEHTSYKNLVDRYSDVSIADLVLTEHKPIDTSFVEEIKSDELYYGRNQKEILSDYEPIDDIYVQNNLERLTNALVKNNLADVYLVSDAKAISGDTIRATNENNKRINIRLAGIDAPKENMYFYNESKQLLDECVKSQEKLTVIEPKKTTYKTDAENHFGHVFTGGISCNQFQITNGGAMFYKPKFYDLFDFQLGNFLYLDDMAKQNRVGLWGERYVIDIWMSQKKDKSMY